MAEKRNGYRLLVGKPEGKRPLGRPRRRWMDNIKMDLLEMGLSVAGWIGLTQDRYRWRALVNSVMNLRVPENAGNYRVAAQLVASRVVVSSTELVSYTIIILHISLKPLIYVLVLNEYTQFDTCTYPIHKSFMYTFTLCEMSIYDGRLSIYPVDGKWSSPIIHRRLPLYTSMNEAACS
jgi:hypothetical protein